MSNLTRSLITALLIAAVATSSAGCAAARLAGLASKIGKVGKVASLGKAGKAASLGKAGNLYTAASGARLAGTFPQPSRVMHYAGGFDRFVPDEVADLYVVAPNDEASFIRIYGRPPSFTELSAAESTTAAVSSAEGGSQVSSAKSGVEKFASFLDDSPSKNIIIVGHNKGGTFYFPNGEGLPLDKMARMLNERNKRGIFLSCRAKKYVPEGHPASTVDLTHQEAMDIVHDLSWKMRSERYTRLRINTPTDDLATATEDAQLLGEQHLPGRLADVGDRRTYELISETITSAERSAAVERTVRRVSKGGAGGGVVYYVVQLTAKRKAAKRGRSKLAPAAIPANPSVTWSPSALSVLNDLPRRRVE